MLQPSSDTESGVGLKSSTKSCDKGELVSPPAPKTWLMTTCFGCACAIKNINEISNANEHFLMLLGVLRLAVAYVDKNVYQRVLTKEGAI